MSAGKFNRRIRFESPPVAQDADYGAPEGDWVPQGNAWAWIEDVLPSKSESFSGGLQLGQKPARIRIRRGRTIDSVWRIVLLDRSDALMKIVAGPAEVQEPKCIEFMAVEYSATGAAA